MAGRKTKLSDKRQAAIVEMVKTGVSVADACANAGIAVSTFYDWIKRGEAGEVLFSEFSEAIAKAYNDAKVTAIGTLRSAMSPYTQKSTSTKTYTEVRVLKNRSGEVLLDEDGNPKTYEHVERTVTKTETVMLGDWRAAVEFLKRKYPDEWRDSIKIEDWKSQAIADIRAGSLDFPTLETLFDRATAIDLFASAGIDMMVGSDE